MDHCSAHLSSLPTCPACIEAKREYGKPTAADLDAVAAEQEVKEATRQHVDTES